MRTVGICVIAVVLLAAAGTVSKSIEDKNRKEAQAALDQTEAGKKAKLRRERNAGQRAVVAQFCEDTFLKHGVDLQCISEESTLTTLLVIGPAVNRPFAYQFVRNRNVMNVLRQAEFTTVNFSNDQGFSQEFTVSPIPPVPPAGSGRR